MVTAISLHESEWWSLAQASQFLGVHYTTLRRWADAGSIPCFRTPGGHRRFRAADLSAWLEGKQSTGLARTTEALMESAVDFTRQQMEHRAVAGESWYQAFDRTSERQQMRQIGRNLFGLAIRYVSRSRGHPAVLEEGRRIGHFYGEQCAQRHISLVDTVRAFSFFRESLLRVIGPGQATSGQYDAEDLRIHGRLRYFLDEVLYACLVGYERNCPGLLPTTGER